MAKFSEVLTIINGRNQKQVVCDGGKYPIYGSGGIMGYANDYICKAETVVIGRKGSINKPIFVETPFWNVDTAFGLCANSEKLNPKYLYYFCEKFDFEKLNTTVTIPSLTKSNLLNVEIPLPNLEKQKQIVELLDKVTSLIFLRKQQLSKLDELIKARFVEMFGNIIRNDKSWPIHNFSDIASSRLGKMLDAKQQTGKYSYPYLANFNVQWFNFNVDNLNQMDFNEAEQKEFELRDGDLLVCEGGEIGRCAVWHNEIQPCFFQKALHRVRCNRQLVQPDYLAWWFKYNCNHGGFAEIAGAKATIAHLPGIKLKQLQVALPPLSLQNEFAAFVERVDQQKQTVQQSLEKLELMKKALMQEYFG
ncbi:MAG: restriction endonuclease subunit S [Clostridiales bacterium 42_27]|nr:MAG: restriction endonuclease subunit S [Clostridiales bacterium 42_27]